MEIILFVAFPARGIMAEKTIDPLALSGKYVNIPDVNTDSAGVARLSGERRQPA
jgi:hypothetical protein